MDSTTAPAANVPLGFSPTDAAFKRDPYPYYERLRREAPVHRGDSGFWTVARHDDVTQVLKTPLVFSSAGMGGPIGGGATSGATSGAMSSGGPMRSIITSDPPVHTGFRNLVNRAFTPRMVADMEPRIREIARGLIDAVAPSGTMDVVRDLATPLPVIVIAEILGVDATRRDDFKRWSNAIVGGFNDPSPEGQQARQRDREEFFDYFQARIDERRAHPVGDMLSTLVAAEALPGGEDAEFKLTPQEVAGFAMLLLVAGNETTTNLIGNAMLALTADADPADREQMRIVTDDASTIPNMVEEALRYDAPVQFLFRLTTQDARVGDQTIPAGNVVVPIYASANRDDEKYPDGARFDVTRNAQGHLAFGLGPHFCLGAPLARLEAKVAFEELFSRARNIERAGEPVRADHMFLRGLTSMPVSFEPA
jgi:cytochrome P450